MPSNQQQRRFVVRRPIFFIVTLSFITFVISSWFAGSSRLSSSFDVQQHLTEGNFLQFDADYHELIRRANTTDPYKCTKDVPCHTEACCGSFGDTDIGTCGFGPTFCGDDCTSQCDAKPECGQYADPPGKTCPLNVCCSKFGFCGSTELFCDAEQECQSNCGHPGPPGGASPDPVTSRVVGYYEAWSARRECHPMPPSSIPVDGLTHVNFAFAYIDPGSYEVTPMDSLTPASLFAQTADVRSLKSGNSQLEVFVSIGGWTFSDNGTATQPVLGEIAASSQTRQKFADNLVSFMQNYGFDGVDLDWEYPGAPDRGGNKADTENMVALFKTLRETFDRSRRGSYGLTFTIPSSYWYLRWFDLPGLLKYADWTNLMSYDLHGVWDKENPIGSIVLAHTNLTEIKQSVDLLWRNDVPPGKVVLGLGFYGRSFELSDGSCAEAGCPFSGAAAPGACTNSAGTLAYFEIQDIIKRESPAIHHDEEAAVNYFKYGDNQWVSWDDDTTFKQKVDWANSIGLGGLMIWSVDQDDNDFSALTGLLGKSPGAFGDLKRNQKVSDAEHWASMNGQKCIMTDCATLPQCPKDYELAPFPGAKAFRDDCPKNQDRVICCPVDAMPQECVWRGGESGRSCHGQCHVGETTLFHSRHATVDCLHPGFQAACCKASTYSNLIDACHRGSAQKRKKNTACGSGEKKIEDVFDYLRGDITWLPGSGWYFPICCPEESVFDQCHWIGKGTCDDNECDDSDVEVWLSPYGNGGSQCASGLNGRQKVLCCDAPKNLSPYLPVDLSKIFPTLPPKSDYPQFDEQLLGGDNSPVVNEPNQQTFGLVVIDGPPDAVQSMRRRDDSAFEVISCDLAEEGLSTVRIVCKHGAASKCLIGGGSVDGTILTLPETCGPASYVVAHKMSRSSNQDIPLQLKQTLPPGSVVQDVLVSYDFSLAKRDAGDIYVRIDYSNSRDYWDRVVQGDPVQKRSLDRRFWSPNPQAWRNIFDDLRGSSSVGESSLRKTHFNQLLVADSSDGKHCDKDDGFMKVSLGGSVVDSMNFGFSFVGTISPTFNIEEANGYFDSGITYQGSISIDAKGSVNIDGGLRSAPLFSTPITQYAFNHPGICSFAPALNIQTRLTGSGDLDGKLFAYFVGGNDGMSHINQPSELGAVTGGVSNQVLDVSFVGDISTTTSPTGKSKRQQDGAATPFGMEMILQSLMSIKINQYESTAYNVNSTLLNQVDSRFRIKSDADVTFSNAQAGFELDAPGGLPGWTRVDLTDIGDAGTVNVLHQGASTPPDRGEPDMSGNPLFGSRMISCSGGGRGSRACGGCTLMSNMTFWDPSLNIDPDSGAPYEDQYGDSNSKRELVRRKNGGERNFTVAAPPGGTSFVITSLPYVFSENGAALLRANPNAGRWGAEDGYDCDNLNVAANAGDPDARYVTEHPMELQYLKNLLNFFMTGMNRDSDGTRYTGSHDLIPQSLLDAGSLLQTDYATWDPNGGRTGTPLMRLFEAFGSTNNPQRNVNAEKELNSFKERIWAGHLPMADDTWDSNGYNDYTLPDSCERANGAISTINQAYFVFNYMNGDVGEIFAEQVETLREELSYFSERVNAHRSRQIPDLGAVHLDYMYNVVFRRMERVENWVIRRTAQLRETWQAAQRAGHAHAAEILASINSQVRDPDDLVLDMGRFPTPPPDKR